MRAAWGALDPCPREDADARAASERRERASGREGEPSHGRAARAAGHGRHALARRVDAQNLDDDARISVAAAQRPCPREPRTHARVDFGDDARVGDERRRRHDGEAIVAPLARVERPIPARRETERRNQAEKSEPRHPTSRFTILPGT